MRAHWKLRPPLKDYNNLTKQKSDCSDTTLATPLLETRALVGALKASSAEELSGAITNFRDGELLQAMKDLNPTMDMCTEFGISQGTLSRAQSRVYMRQETLALARSSILRPEVREAVCPGPSCNAIVFVERNALYECPSCQTFRGWYVRYNKNAFGAFLSDAAAMTMPGTRDRIQNLEVTRTESWLSDTARQVLHARLVEAVTTARAATHAAAKSNYNCHTDTKRGWDFVSATMLQNTRLSQVIFLDADNAGEEIRRLSWLIPTDDTLLSFHVVAIAGQQTAIPPFWPFGAHWCSWISAPTSKKQAADMAIMSTATMLHLADSARRLRFVVVSRDYFADAMASTLVAFGHTCDAIDHSSLDLGLFLLGDDLLRHPQSSHVFSAVATSVQALLRDRYVLERRLDEIQLAIELTRAVTGGTQIARSRATVTNVHCLDEYIAVRRKTDVPAPAQTALSTASPASSTHISPFDPPSRSASMPTPFSLPLPHSSLLFSLQGSPRPAVTPDDAPTPVRESSLPSLSSSADSTSPRDTNSPARLVSTQPLRPPPAAADPLLTTPVKNVQLNVSAPAFVPGTLTTPVRAISPLLIPTSTPTFSPIATEGYDPSVVYRSHPVLQELKTMLARTGELSLSTIGQRLPWTDQLAIAFKCDKWLPLLARPPVAEFLNSCIQRQGKGVHVLRLRRQPASPFAPGEPADPALLTPEKLRAAYKTGWYGKQSEFAARYKINAGNLSSFLNQRREADPASCAAIRRWLQEQLNDADGEVNDDA